MRAGQAMVVWVLLAAAGAFLVLAAGATWYEFSSDMPGQTIGPFASSDSDIEPPALLIHTALHQPWHSMESGGSGTLRDYEQVPFVAAVTATVAPLFYLGAILVAVGIVAAVLRLSGRHDASGASGYVALFGVLLLAFALSWFAGTIATGYEQQLSHSGPGAFDEDAPELAFFTAGLESPEGRWTNVSSAPQLGWWAGVVGTGSAAGAFGIVFAADVRSLRPRRPLRKAPAAGPAAPAASAAVQDAENDRAPDADADENEEVPS